MSSIMKLSINSTALSNSLDLHCSKPATRSINHVFVRPSERLKMAVKGSDVLLILVRPLCFETPVIREANQKLPISISSSIGRHHLPSGSGVLHYRLRV